MGYANGLTILADEETGTLWDHITGEAFEGPLKGTHLQTWPVFVTTAEAELARPSRKPSEAAPDLSGSPTLKHDSASLDPQASLTPPRRWLEKNRQLPDNNRLDHSETQLYSSSHRSLGTWAMRHLQKLSRIRKGGWIPPTFYGSMARPIDPRLPKLTQGLGILVGDKARYYPLDLIPKSGSVEDNLGGRDLQVQRNLTSGLPIALWKANQEPPMQFLSRWYGFSFTYPDCTIFRGG